MKKSILFLANAGHTILTLQKDLEGGIEKVLKECDRGAYGYDYDAGLNCFFNKTAKLNKILSVINYLKNIQENKSI